MFNVFRQKKIATEKKGRITSGYFSGVGRLEEHPWTGAFTSVVSLDFTSESSASLTELVSFVPDKH